MAATRLPHPWDSPGKNTRVGCHFLLQRMKVKSESEVAQSCPTLSDPMDCSLPGSSIHGIFQARILEWVVISFSNACMLSHFSHIQLCDPIDGSHQAHPSLGFSRQEHWSGLPFPSPARESEVAQSCPTVCDPMDCSPPGSSVHGIFPGKNTGVVRCAINCTFLLK